MKRAQVRPSEVRRLAALRSYSILDTEPEPGFDGLAKLAARGLNAPIALVALADASREWFKARYGLDVTESPRDVAFSAHVVAADAPIVVPDVWDDERFAGGPLVVGDPRVRFFAAMPLRTPDGYVLGALCVLDSAPKRPSPEQLESLELVAAQVMDRLEARKNRLSLAELRDRAAEATLRMEGLFEALKVATDRVEQQQHLVTTGTLAAGVGHEINNALTYVINNLDFSSEEAKLLLQTSPSARMNELVLLLGQARDGAERIRKIVHGLRALSRQDIVLQRVDVRAVIETSLSMAAHEIRHKARVARALMGATQILGDESRLTQVLVNLLVNAAQAFPSAEPEKNRITITSLWRADGRVAIAVSDNGPGIPGHLRRRIFDPFFTTKPVGEGTGLGLSVSQSIVSALGGELLVESDEGRGATFSIVLPATPATIRV